MIDRDQVTLETTTTRRRRLASVLTYGPVDARRRVTTNVARFLGSAILAAVIGVACLGTSWVLATLETDSLNKTAAAYDAATRQAPVPDPNLHTDPRTGYPIDRVTGYVVSPKGRWFDRVTGWEVDQETRFLIEPQTGNLVDPETGRAMPPRRES